MTRCAANGCSNVANHTFPKDIKRRELWEKALRRENWKAGDTSRLCANHFKADDFYETAIGDPCPRKYLKKTAVPSIFSKPNSPPKNNDEIKNEAVSPLNMPIKEEEGTSSNINNALRNRSMRLKNRKAYLLNRKCSVPLCNSRPSNEISLHPCPNNAAVRNEWAEALRVSYQYVKNMVACSLHFTKINFIQSSNSELILKHNAVPSRNLPIRKKVEVIGRNKVFKKDGFERQQKMSSTVGTKEELIPEQFPRECRACLKKLDKKSCCNVFQAWVPPWDGMEATIAEDLAKLANVEISPQDRHSKILCAPCYQMLLDAATFAANVRNCDLLLRMRFTAEIDMEKVWPKPIQVDKNINGSVYNTSTDIEIKQEVVSDEEYPVNVTDNSYAEAELSTLDIKIEPEELVEPPPMNITINDTISLDPLNSENKDVKKAAEVTQNTNSIFIDIKEEPISEGEQEEVEQTPDLTLECLLCSKLFNSVTGLKAHVIAQHSYKSVKRKADGSESPEKKRRVLHQCAICKRSFQTPTDLMVHETCHNKHACYGCTEKFDSFELLTRHRKRCKASIGNSVQKLKTLEDVKRPLPQEKVELKESVKPETTDKEEQNSEMKVLETIKVEDIEMTVLNEVDNDIQLESLVEKADTNEKLVYEIKEEDSVEKFAYVITEEDSVEMLESVIAEDSENKITESEKEEDIVDKLESVITEDSENNIKESEKEADGVEMSESVNTEDSGNQTAENEKEDIVDKLESLITEDSDNKIAESEKEADSVEMLESIITEDSGNQTAENEREEDVDKLESLITEESDNKIAESEKEAESVEMLESIITEDSENQTAENEKEEDIVEKLKSLITEEGDNKIAESEKEADSVEMLESIITEDSKNQAAENENEEDIVEKLESLITEDNDNKTAGSEKEEFTAEVSKTESKVEDSDSNMELHLEIHSTKNETEPTLCDADMPLETLDNDDSI